MATTPKLKNPTHSSDLNSKPTADEDALTKQTPAFSGGRGDESKGESAAITLDTHDSGTFTDFQKKAKRAERFGMPVQMNEKEKRNSRAERFGTAPAANGSDTCKASEELKKKTRAERFGIVHSDSFDEEAKKKSRLARFGSIPKTDSVEEDKKKARAIRFSQPDPGSKTNGKENLIWQLLLPRLAEELKQDLL